MALSTCLLIIFSELNAGNLQLGYSSLHPFKKSLPLPSCVAWGTLWYVFPTQQTLTYYFCRIMLFFTVLQAALRAIIKLFWVNRNRRIMIVSCRIFIQKKMIEAMKDRWRSWTIIGNSANWLWRGPFYLVRAWWEKQLALLERGLRTWWLDSST